MKNQEDSVARPWPSVIVALSGEHFPSLIMLRLKAADPDDVAKILMERVPKVAAALSRGCAVTIGDDHVRIRALPIE